MSRTAPTWPVRVLAAATLGALVVCSPRLAWACSVCSGGANDQTQVGFLAGSLLLSILPLALIGGIALWIRGRARRITAQQVAGRIQLPDQQTPRRTAAGSPQPVAL